MKNKIPNTVFLTIAKMKDDRQTDTFNIEYENEPNESSVTIGLPEIIPKSLKQHIFLVVATRIFRRLEKKIRFIPFHISHTSFLKGSKVFCWPNNIIDRTKSRNVGFDTIKHNNIYEVINQFINIAVTVV